MLLRSRISALGAVAVLTLVAAACGDGPTAASQGVTSGDATTADPAVESYFPGVGTDRIDVQSYDVDAVVDIDGEDRLDAVATISAVALDDLATFSLDLSGMKVGDVVVNGRTASSRVDGAHLVVTPDRAVPKGSTFAVEVHYGGAPAGGRDAETILEDSGGWLDLAGYSVVVAEPIGASTWLPVNDVPWDKATFDLTVTVDAGLDAVSNGLLVDPVRDDGDARTFHWAAVEPMAPYLMTLAVGDFDLVASTLADGTPVIDAVPPDTGGAIRAELARFPEMVAFLGSHLGRYPFGSAGNIVVPGMPPTALETQTRSVLSVAAMGEPDPDQLLVHELAHQWFGDSVTPATWADIWLNEGPAVFWQWRWAESTGGPTLEQSAQMSWDAADASMDVPPADPGEDELFGRSVYERSAIFLVELRLLMGDEAFEQLMRSWLTDHAGGVGTTEEFVELAGTVHGSPITALSDPWLYGDELPDLSF